MKKEVIIKCIQNLARSQGCWGRLLKEIFILDPEDQKQYWQSLEDMNFNDSLDLILFLEGNA